MSHVLKTRTGDILDVTVSNPLQFFQWLMIKLSGIARNQDGSFNLDYHTIMWLTRYWIEITDLRPMDSRSALIHYAKFTDRELVYHALSWPFNSKIETLYFQDSEGVLVGFDFDDNGAKCLLPKEIREIELPAFSFERIAIFLMCAQVVPEKIKDEFYQYLRSLKTVEGFNKHPFERLSAVER